MANKDLSIVLQSRAVAGGVSKVTGQLGGLEQVLTRLSGKLAALLAGASLADRLADAAASTGELDRELSDLSKATGRLKTALGNAIAPILEAVLPAVTGVTEAVARVVEDIARLTRALFGTDSAAGQAAQGQEALATATDRAAKAAKRSLAAFDQLNRLSDTTSAADTGTAGDAAADAEDLTELGLNGLLLVGTLQQMLAALKELDFSRLRQELEALWVVLEPLVDQLLAGLQWAFYNVLLPVSQWAAQTLLPLFLQTVAAALDALSKTIEACRPALAYLWEEFFKPLGKWAGDALVQGLEWLMEKLEAVSLWMEHNQVPVDTLLGAAGTFLGLLALINGALSIFNGAGATGSGVVNTLTSSLQGLHVPVELTAGLIGLLSAALQVLAADWSLVRRDSEATVQGLQSGWQGLVGWFRSSVLQPLRDSFRSTVNGIIGFFNSLLQGVTNGINGLIRALNRVSFTVPDWVPELGGTSFGISLSSVTAPQIPYLARGAVLPANRPFMAVVGDQRHGTNIEAPLETIRQAVAMTMEDMAASQLAGQEATVAVLGQILEAVLGIHIGDGDIALAVDRYNSRRAVITGGR